MQPTMEWFQRKFQFDLPVWMFPNVVERLRGGPARVEERVKDLSPRVLIHRDGDRWSIQENIGHLLVVESLWVRRLEDFIAGKPELFAADLKNTRSHESNFNELPLEDTLSDFRKMRMGFVEKMDGFDEAFVGRTALHPRLQQPMRVIDSAFFAAEHDDHHLARITELIGMFG
jgi:hypothetical protein